MSTTSDTYPFAKLLESGYWYVRFSPLRFAQWPSGRPCRAEDFHEPQWTEPDDVRNANLLTNDGMGR